MTRTTRAVVFAAALLMCCVAVYANAADVGADTAEHRFHCRRAFESLGEFGQLSKLSPEANCQTPYFNVTDASVDVVCDDAHDVTCRAIVNLGLRTAKDAAERLSTQLGSPDDYFASEGKRDLWLHDVMGNMPTDGTDPWRFSLALRSVAIGTVVKYNGFDGNGYSMCCEMLNSSHEGTTGGVAAAHCQHLPGARGDNDMALDSPGNVVLPFRVVRHCALPVPFSQLSPDSQDKTVYGSVSKPLHVLEPGPWEARLTLWRSRGRWVSDDDVGEVDGTKDAPEDRETEKEVLLRVVIPFNVSRSLWDNGMPHATPGVVERHDKATVLLTDEDADL